MLTGRCPFLLLQTRAASPLLTGLCLFNLIFLGLPRFTSTFLLSRAVGLRHEFLTPPCYFLALTAASGLHVVLLLGQALVDKPKGLAAFLPPFSC